MTTLTITDNDKELIKGIFLFTMIFFKSFFKAITEVAWGFVSLIGLNLLLSYIITSRGMDYPIEVDNLFLYAGQLIFNNWIWFVIAIFVLVYYSEYKEINK